MATESLKEMEKLKRAVQELTKENNHFKRMYEICSTLRPERNIDNLLPLILTEVSNFLNAERSSLFLIDYDTRCIWTRYAEGMEEGKIKIKLAAGLVGSCVLMRKLVNTTDAYTEPSFNVNIDKKTGYRTESVLCTPFFNQNNEIVGALQLLNKKTGVFIKKDEDAALKTAAMLKSLDMTHKQDQEKAISLVQHLRDGSQADRSSIFLLDREKAALRTLMADHIEGWNISINLNLGIAALVAVTGEEIVINDACTDTRVNKSVDRHTGYQTRSLLCLPLISQAGEIFGVIETLNKINGVFSGYDKKILKYLSYYVAMFVENAILLDEQDHQFNSILAVMAASIDAKDPMTAGHSEKVAEYAVGIGRKLGYGEADTDTLHVAALLHDYGKIGIDDQILKKPGKLDKEQFDLIKHHVANTKSILDRMSFARRYKRVPVIASSHHERLDGSGYGEGLKDNQIPFMAKILAVADVFDAITTNRHYHKALPPEEAFKILDQEAGTKLDKNIIAALKSYCKKHGRQQ